jgi:hypothetical protein
MGHKRKNYDRFRSESIRKTRHKRQAHHEDLYEDLYEDSFEYEGDNDSLEVERTGMAQRFKRQRLGPNVRHTDAWGVALSHEGGEWDYIEYDPTEEMNDAG